MSKTEQTLEAIWTAAFGQPPAIHASAECLADHLVRYLPAAPCYAPSRATRAPETDFGAGTAGAAANGDDCGSHGPPPVTARRS